MLFNAHKFLIFFIPESTCRRTVSTMHPTTDSEACLNTDVNTMLGTKRPVDDDREHEAKIQKTETETIQTIEAETVQMTATETVQKIKRKNHAMLLGYVGKDYYGMQRNPRMKTIEEDLVIALLKANLINSGHFDNIRIINFQRAARTDKGVSAIRQVVSLKLRKMNILNINLVHKVF